MLTMMMKMSMTLKLRPTLRCQRRRLMRRRLLRVSLRVLQTRTLSSFQCTLASPGLRTAPRSRTRRSISSLWTTRATLTTSTSRRSPRSSGILTRCTTGDLLLLPRVSPLAWSTSGRRTTDRSPHSSSHRARSGWGGRRGTRGPPGRSWSPSPGVSPGGVPTASTARARWASFTSSGSLKMTRLRLMLGHR